MKHGAYHVVVTGTNRPAKTMRHVRRREVRPNSLVSAGDYWPNAENGTQWSNDPAAPPGIASLAASGHHEGLTEVNLLRFGR